VTVNGEPLTAGQACFTPVVGINTLTLTATDDCGATASCITTVTVTLNQPPVVVCPSDQAVLACNLDPICVPGFSATDPDGNLTSARVNGEPLTAGQACFTPVVGVNTLELIATDACGATTSCITTVTVTLNQPPVVVCPSDQAVFACNLDPICIPGFSAADPDGNLTSVTVNGEPLTAGQACFTPVAGINTLTLTATDACGATASCITTVTVTLDQAPVFTVCSDPNPVAWGDVASGSVTAVDPDGGPDPLVYSYLGTYDGPGNFTVHPDGTWDWPTIYGNSAYSGEFPISIVVTDGCKKDTCNFTVHIVGMYAEIGKMHKVLQGRYAFDSIYVYADGMQLGGIDLLIAYDASALTLSEVLRDQPGVTDTVYGAELSLWEYFTYRFGANGNCNGACPSGLVRIIAIADMNNGYAHPYPDFGPNNAYNVDGLVATLKFLVTSDRTYQCQFVPVGFYWLDCTDNVLSSRDGQTAFISHMVWWYTGDYPPSDYVRLDNNPGDTYFAGYGGWGGILDEPDCLEGVGQKVPPLDWVDFYDGGIDIVCGDSIDARGDINLNGIANEIADAVIYTQYFLIGLDAFAIGGSDGRQASIAASDINADGKPLSIGDLVYLLRIVVGDASPFVKSAPYSSNADISVIGDKISIVSSETIGAMYLTFNVTGDFTLVNHTNMEVLSNQVGDKLNVLVYSGMSNMSNAIPAGTNELLTVTGAQLNSVEASDYYGSLLNTRVAKSALPTQFSLSQNIPNPFNPATKIGLDLPSFTSWQIGIYNVNGQLVQSYNGTNIGHVEVTWDASNAASGIYFYKVTAGSFTDTKKMVLMK
jgi:hypothetical protein